MSTKTKSIIALIIAVFTVLIIGTTTVNAVEIEVTDEMLSQENYSETEQQKVNEIVKEINTEIAVTLELSEMLKEDGGHYAIIDKELKQLKEAGYTIVKDGIYGGGDVFFSEGRTNCLIYKNDIHYGTIGIIVRVYGKVTIPSTVEDTETAIINYATPKIIEYLMQKQFLQNNENIILEKDDGEYYKVSNKTTQELIGTILLNKEETTTTTTTKEDTTTGIRVVGNFESTVVLESKKVEEQKTINIVDKALKEISSQYTIYDINLLKDGVKIQPDGKVKVSIPIPEGYDKTRLEIYRIETDGTKIKYDVTVDGNYATFETDHFSIYVLAEKEQEETETTTTTLTATTNEEKDETPKTGTADITKYIVTITVISALGIIALKKKETK